MHVVTSSKGPMALAGLDLLALARVHGVQLRMESTIMSGTPVLSPIREGMAGTRIRAIRGILNGTVNSILSAMATGHDYAEALAQAQAQGYAEADPTDDVEGDDTVAKTLILAAAVFGRALAPEQVVRRGITALTREQMQQAEALGKRIKHVASLRLLAKDGWAAQCYRYPNRYPCRGDGDWTGSRTLSGRSGDVGRSDCHCQITMRETAIDSKGGKIATPARDAHARATRVEMLVCIGGPAGEA